MLENDPVGDLQERSQGNRVARVTQAQQVVYKEQPATITIQPRQQQPPASLNVARMAIPVSTIQFDGGAQIPSHSPYIPQSGLDFIRGIPSLHIYQTYELNESLTALSSENRFSVRAPFNETLYVATESSTSKHRTYLGAGRPFTMHLLDKTNQEALVIRRNLACGLMCCACVAPQSVEVWLPPGDLIGYVQEVYNFFGVELTIQDSNLGLIYQIEGPQSWTKCLPKETHFRILTMGGNREQVGSITRTWNADNSSYSTNIYFNDANMDVRRKSLFLGAAFLLEYMFFQGKNCCY